MKHRAEVSVARSSADVFAVYADLEGWPRWTPSVSAVDQLDSGPVRVGTRARVQQPGLPPAIWTVTELAHGASFSWETAAPGIRSIGRHTVRAHGDHCIVTAELEQLGPLAGLVRLLRGGLIGRYLSQEAEGIKRYCEDRRDQG